LTGWSLQAGVPLDGLTVSRPSLEDVYLELTKDQPGMGDDAPAQPDEAGEQAPGHGRRKTR
jgi:hypothetical protein